ncbi:hypothetical protein [Rickettsiella endosymbiont of Rhagonycha lignosa]|uniref:hypothetical protein n=1 Tax=Rickettsiella endosymbiont of Rhagonycha lignosa TaxID=3077937 RepID=UPI00313B3941
MPMIVSSIKKHITTTEFWRAMSFVLKRLETIAKYLTKLPLPFTFSLYILHLTRAGLRIYSYFSKTKNKNLGDTFKLLFAVFKVSIAIIALILLGWGLVSLPAVLLSAFFAYSILKLIHSSIVLCISSVSYLKIDKNCLEQQWRRAHYRDNITKHVSLLSGGLLFILLTCLFNAGASILIWTNPLLLLGDVLICLAVLASVCYFSYRIAQNKRTASENAWTKRDTITTIKKFLLLFGLNLVILLVIATAPSLGVAAVISALILLCTQDVLLTIYYYFYGVYIADPEPANLDEEQLNSALVKTRRDYYDTLFPALYLQTQVSEKLPCVEDVIKTNKKLLVKLTLLKILDSRNERAKIAKLGIVSRFFSLEKTSEIKEECLLHELAWALNTDNLQDLIELILASSDLFANNRAEVLGDLELQKILGHLVGLAEQEKRVQQAEIVKPKAFYQSFWKKVGACEAISQALQASREIETHLNSNSLVGFM